MAYIGCRARARAEQPSTFAFWKPSLGFPPVVQHMKWKFGDTGSTFGPIDSGESIAGTDNPENPTWPHLGRYNIIFHPGILKFRNC